MKIFSAIHTIGSQNSTAAAAQPLWTMSTSTLETLQQQDSTDNNADEKEKPSSNSNSGDFLRLRTHARKEQTSDDLAATTEIYSSNSSLSSLSSASSVSARPAAVENTVEPLLKTTTTTVTLQQDSSNNDISLQKRRDMDNEAYLSKREMTLLQEQWNALTVLPNALYCFWYLYSNKNVHSTILAVALGILVHAPFSFTYHWQYAPRLARHDRIHHWSRRFDQIMIHVASTCMSYGTSHSLWWLGLNIVYNGDCIVRQLQTKVYPLRNQIRIGISMILYTVPILLLSGGLSLFFRCWLVMGVSSWLFATYPFAGWSHSVFHIVACFLPPLLFEAAEIVVRQQ